VKYPTELVAKAQYEMHVFERVSADTGAELIAEVIRLRELAKNMATAIENLDAPGGCSGLAYALSLAEQAPQ